jgi:hypothetical protein
LKEGIAARRNYRGEFERRHRGKEETIVVDLKEGIVPVRKSFTPIFKSHESVFLKWD